MILMVKTIIVRGMLKTTIVLNMVPVMNLTEQMLSEHVVYAAAVPDLLIFK